MSTTLTKGPVIYASNAQDPDEISFSTNTSGILPTAASGGTLSSFSINLDSAHATNPVTGSFTAVSNGNSMASQIRTAVTSSITSGNVTGLTVKAGTNNVVELDSTNVGVRTNISVTIGNPGTGAGVGTASAGVVTQAEGVDGVVRLATAWRLESPSHSPSVSVGTFPNSVTPGVAIQTIRNTMVNIGYSVGVVVNGSTLGSFTATSTTAGVEEDISFTITEAGTGGDLVASSNVTTQGADTFNVGTLTSISIVVYGQTFPITFTSDSTAASQATQANTIITSIGTNLTTSITSNVLTATSTLSQGQADAVVTVIESGTVSSGTYTPPRAVVTTQGLTSGKIAINVTGGGITGTVFVNDDDEYTKAELITVLSTLINNNIGVFTYEDGTGDIEFASNVDNTFPDVQVEVLNSNDGIVIDASTKFLGYD